MWVALGSLYFQFWSWYSCWLWCQVWNICYEWLLVCEVVLQQQLIGGRCSGEYLEHSVHTFTSIFCLFYLFFFLTVQDSSIGDLVSEWSSAEGFSSVGGLQRPISPQVLTKQGLAAPPSVPSVLSFEFLGDTNTAMDWIPHKLLWPGANGANEERRRNWKL